MLDGCQKKFNEEKDNFELFGITNEFARSKKIVHRYAFKTNLPIFVSF